MQVELAQATTSDDIVLNGFFLAPQGSPPSAAVDAVLLFHGTTGNFYNPRHLMQAASLQKAGYAVASFNTRGHDVIARAAPGRLIGTAFEILKDCLIDLETAINWITERGYRRIALLGVSMGAVKVIYYQAHLQDPRVATVIAVSPLRLSRSYYLTTEAATDYERYYQEAQELIQSGHPEALINVVEDIVPGQGIFGAQAYVEKYGSEKYNLENYAQKVRCPLLIMAGTEETHPRLRDCAQDVYNSFQDKANVELMLIEGAGHGLAEIGDSLPEAVAQWMARTLPQEVTTKTA